MGLWLNEGIIGQPAKLEVAVNDLANSGYGIIRTMLRNTNFNHRSKPVIEAVAHIVKVAHSKGVCVVLDCEPHAEPIAEDMGELFPHAIGVRIVRAEAPVVNGKFTLHIPMPSTSGTRADFRGLEGAWLVQAGSRRKIDDLVFQHRVVQDPYSNGFTTATHKYTEGRQMTHQACTHIFGKLSDSSQGQLVVYARFFDSGIMDLWSEDFTTYYDQLLECYRDIPLDGVGWDEPAIGGNWQNYLWGDATAAAFERLNGYALKDRWADLDISATNPASLRVRLDYYRTRNEAVFETQKRLFAKAEQLFGKDLIFGTHHTWQGEGGPNDYRAGAVDYFRLNDNMDAGYTDCWWWDPKSVAYAYTLGSSLGRLTPSGEAEINTWDAKPTNVQVEFQARLMTLLDLTWFNIWYGDTTDTCLYPADYTWETTVREMNRHREEQRRIGRAQPVIEVAILHGWETVCGINRVEIAAAHKSFCLNISKLFLDRNVAFDWIDDRLLSSARIEKAERTRLSNALGSYQILVLPYASVLSLNAWNKCREFILAGGKVVFVGTPPEWDAAGGSIRGEFAKLMEMEELSLETYLKGIDAICTLPKGRADILDVCYELEGDPSRILTSIEGEKHGLKNKSGNAVYLTDLDPRERLLNLIEPWISSEVTCYSDNILWRYYREQEREFVVCIAKEGRQMRGLIRWGKKEVEFHSGTSALLEKINDNLSVSSNNQDWTVL